MSGEVIVELFVAAVTLLGNFFLLAYFFGRLATKVDLNKQNADEKFEQLSADVREIRTKMWAPWRLHSTRHQEGE